MQKTNQEEMQLDNKLDLRGCCVVMMKRKKIIIIVFLISVFISGVMSFLKSNIYNVSMVIDPRANSTFGKRIFIDTPQNITAKIKNKAFDAEIFKALNLNPEKAKLDFEVSQEKDSDLVRIYIPKKKSGAELGQKELNLLFLNLSKSYEEVLEYQRAMLEKQMLVISNNILGKKNEIKLQEKQLKIMDERETDSLNNLKEAKKNSEELIVQRNTFLADHKDKADNMASLLYTNVIQQNIMYFNSLNEELSGLRIKKESILAEIKTLENTINNMQVEVDKLNLTRSGLHNIVVVQEPRVSSERVGPSRKQNVILISFAGLMIGIFLAFFQENWKKNT